MPIYKQQDPPYYEFGTGNEGGQKRYVATIGQAGTSPPTVTIITNTIGVIEWTRMSAGIYVGTLADAFPENKTACLMTETFSAIAGIGPYIAPDSVIIHSRDMAGTFADDLLSGTIEIVIYE